jgi:hypothetical protein
MEELPTKCFPPSIRPAEEGGSLHLPEVGPASAKRPSSRRSAEGSDPWASSGGPSSGGGIGSSADPSGVTMASEELRPDSHSPAKSTSSRDLRASRVPLPPSKLRAKQRRSRPSLAASEEENVSC